MTGWCKSLAVRLVACALAGLTFTAGSAQAADLALARNSLLLFGGPSKDYPRIGLITWGQGLNVLRCRVESKWCEVEADGQRGWVPAASVEFPANGFRANTRKRLSPLRVTL